MQEKIYDIIIIGAGCAGLTAAIYARRAGKEVLLLESETFGGQISFSPKVENYPAVKSISGQELSNNMFEQAVSLGAIAELETVLEIEDFYSIKRVKTDYGEHLGKAIIIATGMKHRPLGLDKESEFIGNGVSYCAVCDGAFYKGCDVSVYGGGDTALSDALFLSDFCKSVTVIHRRKDFRGEKWLSDALNKRENVKFILENVISGLLGQNKLNGLELTNSVTGEKKQIQTDALFVAIGQLPQTELFKGIIDMDENNFIISKEDCLSSVDGIFVAGDCRVKQVRQLTTAASDGAISALSACKYIDQNMK